MPEPTAAPLMEAVHNGIGVTSLGDDEPLGYLALGHHEPAAALCAMSLLDADLYGDLRYVPSAPLLELISLCWARFPPCDCGVGGEDGCYHAWTLDWPVDATADGAVAVTVLDLTTPTRST